MDRHCATRQLRRLAKASVVRLPRIHPHVLRHTFVTTMLDAGLDLRDVQIAARHADPRTTVPVRTSTGIRTTSWRRTWHPQPGTPRTVVPMCGR
ncbi:site-specific integrase [Amycolatopsis sp. NPDC005961]|uniref:site-specific integrase n=1 Tax=Amycolatopsis sp. NPDC005961 TaxID=3156720 RepID=UPI0033D5E5CD